jgi:hypothetical protein
MDLNVRAFRVVQEAISGGSPRASEAKRESGRKGGLKGGPSRASSLTAERRAEIARKASAVRWGRASGRRKR